MSVPARITNRLPWHAENAGHGHRLGSSLARRSCPTNSRFFSRMSLCWSGDLHTGQSGKDTYCRVTNVSTFPPTGPGESRKPPPFSALLPLVARRHSVRQPAGVDLSYAATGASGSSCRRWRVSCPRRCRGRAQASERASRSRASSSSARRRDGAGAARGRGGSGRRQRRTPGVTRLVGRTTQSSEPGSEQPLDDFPGGCLAV